ncbi:hypothetical protein TIFTF001_021640 [Ficus carica]|uniref:Myb/SANT-like domain-containing protein n=1 Tax=Ficus carica TaxID=3494 RepID=A0AA88AYY8_FICCA|nr:hypothetical protein TIFTF001_021640 [Ficus carica]
MPRKTSGDHYFWDAAKETKFLIQLSEYVECSGGKHPPKATLELWAAQFNAEFGGVPAHAMTLYQKKERMKKIYNGWKALQTRTGLGYDPTTDRVVCSDEAWNSFIGRFKECNHLRYEGLRNKELYVKIFEKKHAAGASGYGSVSMPGDSTPYGDVEASMEEYGTQVGLEDDVTPTPGARHFNNVRGGADTGPSRSRASSGKRKQREETNEMTFLAMQEILTHFHNESQSAQTNETANQPDYMFMCMSIMTEMGVPPNHRCRMWHYLDAHPRLQRTFHRLPKVDRREIIASVVQSPGPPTE